LPCPIMGRCKKRVSFDFYQSTCSSVLEEGWRRCDEFVRVTSGERTPSEWSSIVSPFALPAVSPPSAPGATRPSSSSSSSSKAG